MDDIYRYDLTDCEGAWDSEAWTDDDDDDEDGAGLWRVFCEESLEMTCDTLRRPGHQTLDRDHAPSSDQHCQHGSDGSRWLQLQQEKVAVNYRTILIKYCHNPSPSPSKSESKVQVKSPSQVQV